VTSTESPGASTYVLGHADVEVQRLLLLQGRLYNDHTEHALRLAGLREGMRVLDVGCGPGEVSFVAARLVSPTGTVLGIDAAADIIELASTRAAEQNLSTVSFQHTTIADITLDEPVDAVIGRLILMHLPDPVATLRQPGAPRRRHRVQRKRHHRRPLHTGPARVSGGDRRHHGILSGPWP
jgi:2-polyprenyl-3-methyl-5-hydroxy-6-metoxy-1,4-benzoquinol methylase